MKISALNGLTFKNNYQQDINPFLFMPEKKSHFKEYKWQYLAGATALMAALYAAKRMSWFSAIFRRL